MQKPTPLKQLDLILAETLHEKDYFHLQEDILKSHEWLENDEHYLKMILNKLHKDGYVDFLEGEANRKSFVLNREAGYNMYIRRNFNGHTFLEQNGYVGQKTKLDAENTRLGNLENELKVNRDMTLWLTVVLAVGTLVQALIAFLVLLYPDGWLKGVERFFSSF